MINKSFFSILFLLLTSCAVNYKMPSNRFQTPESNGDSHKRFVAGLGRGVDIELTPNYSTTWASTQDPVINEASFYELGLSMGMTPSLDLGVKYVSDLGIMAEGKWQLLGKNKDNGLKVALAVNGGYGSETLSEENNTPSEAKLTNFSIGADFITGYRLGKSFLIYLSAFHDKASYKLRQTRGGVSQSFEGDSKNTGGTAGLELSVSNSTHLILEYARARASSANTALYSDSIGGILAIGF